LHESQRIVEETNDTVLLEIYIHTTNDIIMELLKYGRNVKVVAPKSLVATMKELLKWKICTNDNFTTIDFETSQGYCIRICQFELK
jgi:rRNA pseudouridine-1189 N-methylase Emg1 (Nep1/Mra1 family)